MRKNYGFFDYIVGALISSFGLSEIKIILIFKISVLIENP